MLSKRQEIYTKTLCKGTNNGIIYKATSPSSKIYIGKTKNRLTERIRGHFKDATYKVASSYNTAFSRAIRKYGKNIIFEIVEDDINIEKLNEREIFYIEKFDSFRFGYNSTTGGDGPTEVSEETRQKISKARKGKPSPRKGTIHTEESKKKNVRSKNRREKRLVWKKHTKETKKKMSEAQMGEKNHRYGRPQSEELNKKQSDRMKGSDNPMFGKTHSLETRQKISEAQKKRWEKIKCQD